MEEKSPGSREDYPAHHSSPGGSEEESGPGRVTPGDHVTLKPARTGSSFFFFFFFFLPHMHYTKTTPTPPSRLLTDHDRYKSVHPRVMTSQVGVYLELGEVARSGCTVVRKGWG